MPTDLAKRFEVYRPAAARLGRWRPHPGHGRRQDQGRQAPPQQRLAPDRRGIHQAWRHHRQSRLGHRPGFRTFDAWVCVTSHASQGVTVDKVFVGVSSESLPATVPADGYVALTRGKEQAVVFTDDRQRTAEGNQPGRRSAVGNATGRISEANAGLAQAHSRSGWPARMPGWARWLCKTMRSNPPN